MGACGAPPGGVRPRLMGLICIAGDERVTNPLQAGAIRPSEAELMQMTAA